MKSFDLTHSSTLEKGHFLMVTYKYVSLAMAIIFAIVGLIFLFMTNGVLLFFNDISRSLGMEISPAGGINFYLILAVAYMYLVTLVAYLMYLHPDNKVLLLLLINGKLASSILSFYMLFRDAPYLIYFTNGAVDGLITIIMVIFYIKLKKISE